MSFRRTVLPFVVTLVLGSSLVLGVNLLVDPDDLIGAVDVEGFNSQKTRLFSDARLRKARWLVRGEYDSVFLGTSRVMMSMEPKHRALRRRGLRSTFNAGMQGAGMLEIQKIAEHALEHQRLEVVLLGLDFISFTERRELPVQFERSLFSPDRSRWARPSYLLSIDTFVRAIGTLWDNIRGTRERGVRSGYVPGGEKRVLDHRDAFDQVLERSYLVEEKAYAGFVYGERQLQAFAGAIRSLAEQGVRVEVFFTPTHAVQLEAIRGLGLLETWEQWRTDVTAAVEDVRQDFPGRVGLWDFAGYTPIHTEPIPARRSGVEMRWWYESTHFKEETGDRILRRILDPKPERRGGSSFGVEITAQGIGRRHAKLRRERDVWASGSGAEIERVEEQIERTARIRRAIPAWQSNGGR